MQRVRRFLRSFFRNLPVVGCAAVFATIGAGAFALMCGPAASVRDLGSEKVVDFAYLGEYCIGIYRLRLEDVESGTVIWEVRYPGEYPCKLTLRVGANAVDPERLKGSVVIVPRASDTFEVRAGRTYVLRAWGNDGGGSVGKTTRRIRF